MRLRPLRPSSPGRVTTRQLSMRLLGHTAKSAAAFSPNRELPDECPPDDAAAGILKHKPHTSAKALPNHLDAEPEQLVCHRNLLGIAPIKAIDSQGLR